MMTDPPLVLETHDVMLHGGPPDKDATAPRGSNVEGGTSHQPVGSPVGTALVLETNTRRVASPIGEKKPGTLEDAVGARSTYMRLRSGNCTAGFLRKGVRPKALTEALETHTSDELKEGAKNADDVIATSAPRG